MHLFKCVHVCACVRGGLSGPIENVSPCFQTFKLCFQWHIIGGGGGGWRVTERERVVFGQTHTEHMPEKEERHKTDRDLEEGEDGGRGPGREGDLMKNIFPLLRDKRCGWKNDFSHQNLLTLSTFGSLWQHSIFKLRVESCQHPKQLNIFHVNASWETPDAASQHISFYFLLQTHFQQTQLWNSKRKRFLSHVSGS